MTARLRGHPEEIWGRYSEARWRVAVRELELFEPYRLALATLEWRGRPTPPIGWR